MLLSLLRVPLARPVKKTKTNKRPAPATRSLSCVTITYERRRISNGDVLETLSLISLAVTRFHRKLGQNSPILQFGTTPAQSHAKSQNGCTDNTCEWLLLFFP